MARDSFLNHLRFVQFESPRQPNNCSSQSPIDDLVDLVIQCLLPSQRKVMFFFGALTYRRIKSSCGTGPLAMQICGARQIRSHVVDQHKRGGNSSSKSGRSSGKPCLLQNPKSTIVRSIRRNMRRAGLASVPTPSRLSISVHKHMHFPSRRWHHMVRVSVTCLAAMASTGALQGLHLRL